MATSSDPHDRAQDVKRCQLCPGKDRKSAAETVCNTCHVDLCKECVGHHMISNPTIRHDVVTFEFKKYEIILSQCGVHSEKQCEMFCEQCESPICQKCLASGSHENHNVPHITEICSSKQKLIRKDLNELETIIAPIYETILSEMKEMLLSIEQKHEDRQRILDDIGKTWHNLVDKVIKKYKSDATKKEREDVNEIKTLEADFQKCFLSIQSKMDENKSILASNDPSKLVNYTSDNEKYKTIPSRFNLTVPELSPMEVKNLEQTLCQIIRDIPDTKKTCIQGQVLKALQSNTSSEKAVKKFLDFPLTVGGIKIDETMYQLACIPHTDHFWVSGFDGFIKCMNEEGEVLKKIATENGGSCPLTVTKQGHLVYTEKENRIINLVEGDNIKCLLKIEEWKPGAICSTYTDDLLVFMTLYNEYASIITLHRKVVRYSGSTVTQEIYLSALGLSLISFLHSIDENKNLDIVLSEKGSVLVLNNQGEFRFNYKGMKYRNFIPHCITTDSMCHILIADSGNNIIHIIDQNGQFLFYIDNSVLNKPRGFSIDSNDILYIAETQRVKQIKYMK